MLRLGEQRQRRHIEVLVNDGPASLAGALALLDLFGAAGNARALALFAIGFRVILDVFVVVFLVQLVLLGTAGLFSSKLFLPSRLGYARLWQLGFMACLAGGCRRGEQPRPQAPDHARGGNQLPMGTGIALELMPRATEGGDQRIEKM